MDYGKTLIKDKSSKDYMDLTYSCSKNDIVIQFCSCLLLHVKKEKAKNANWKQLLKLLIDLKKMKKKTSPT